MSDHESDSFNESFNDVMDLKNNLTLSDSSEEDEFEEVEGDESEDDENLLTNNGTESRLQVSLAFNSGPPVQISGWNGFTKPANLDSPANNKVSNFSNSFDLIKSINLINSLRNNPNANHPSNHVNDQRPNGHPNSLNNPNDNSNSFTKSFFSYSPKLPADVKQQVRSKRQCRHNRKVYNGKRRWHNGRDRPNRRTYPHQYNHFKDAPDDEERKWEMIERKRSRV